MPHVIVVIFAALGIGISTATATTILVSLISFSVSLVLGQISKLFRKDAGLSSLSHELATRTVTTRQPVAPWKVAYGSNRLGGIITFLHTTGANNEFLQLVITLTGHEVSAIPAMYFDGVQVPLDGSGNATGNFAGFVHAEFNLGTKDQAAFPGLVTAAPTYWTSAYRQRGRAGVYVQLKWDQNKFPNGVPNITFDLNGRKVYDPRSGTIAYSANAALCIADYLHNASFGLVAQSKAALAAGMLSQSGLGAFNAANCIDADVTTAGWNTDAAVPNANLQLDLGVGNSAEYRRCRIYAAANLYAGIYDVQYSDDGSSWTAAATGFKPNVIGWNEVELAPNGAHRYWRLNLTNTPGATGTLNELEFYTSDVDSTQLIAAANTCDEAVSLAAGGTENRFTINGSFGTDEKPADVIGRMNSALAGSVVYLAGKWGIYPGIWRAPTVTLTDADFRGPFTVQTRMPHRDLYNGVKGTFISPTNKWQISDYPPFQSAAYLQEDNNEALWLDVELPFTISGATAQRLSKIALRRARRQITVQGQFKLTAYQVQPLDVVQLSHPRFGWTNKTFEVAACNLVYAPDNQAGGSALAVGVDLTLRETDSTVYDWTTADEVQLNAPPTTVLPQNAVTQAPTSFAINPVEIVRSADGVRQSFITATWTAPADQFVTAGGHIVIQYKKTADSLWTSSGRLDGAVTSHQVGPLLDGVSYDVRIWAENASGVKSTVQTLTGTSTGTNFLVTSTPLNTQGNIPASSQAAGILNLAYQSPVASYSVLLTWGAISNLRADGSTLPIAANPTDKPATPTVGQVAGGALGARTRVGGVAYVKNGMIFGISANATSFAVSANNLFKITSPAANGAYDGWVPVVGDGTNPGVLQNGGLGGGVLGGYVSSPIAFGTDWTEPTAGANITNDATHSNVKVNQGGPQLCNLAVSTSFKIYPYYDLVKQLVLLASDGTSIAFTSSNVTAAAAQSGDGKIALSAGPFNFTTPASGTGSAAGGGGGGGGRGLS